jgi:O-succinylbenzoate synthase
LPITGIALEYADLSIGVDGWSAGGRIGIRTGLSPAEEFSVLVHEFAHELLHGTGKRWLVNRTVRETEAEAVAFVVCEAIGLETNQAAADYIQLYDGDRDTLLNSLDRIQRTARVMIDGLMGTKAEGPRPGASLLLSS